MFYVDLKTEPMNSFTKKHIFRLKSSPSRLIVFRLLIQLCTICMELSEHVVTTTHTHIQCVSFTREMLRFCEFWSKMTSCMLGNPLRLFEDLYLHVLQLN